MGPARDSFLFEIVFCHLSKDPSCDAIRFINLSFIPVELNWYPNPILFRTLK